MQNDLSRSKYRYNSNSTVETIALSIDKSSTTYLAISDFAILQRWEQYLTSSQSLRHFFLQVKGRLQTTQIFSGRFSFLYANSNDDDDDNAMIACNFVVVKNGNNTDNHDDIDDDDICDDDGG